jgi:hypothetical protein
MYIIRSGWIWCITCHVTLTQSSLGVGVLRSSAPYGARSTAAVKDMIQGLYVGIRMIRLSWDVAKPHISILDPLHQEKVLDVNVPRALGRAAHI